ncbi:MAG: (Fe-S)-binding protein, partial [Firmicutes bacterium]|nr:(Fe-S)-binding protein [Bacillota bacterium]
SEYLVQVDAAISAGGTKPAPTGGTVASSVDSSLGSSGFRRGGKTAIEENGLAASVGAASKQQQFGDMTVYRADSARALSEYQQPGGGSGHWADPAPRSLSQRRGGFRGPVQDKLDLNRTARHLKVTYHDPCHLNRGQGIGQEPRQVIASLPGVELVEGKEAARCCGGAGTFAFFHQPISEAILKRKVDDILATGADVVATGCPSCLMQLESGLSQAQSRVRVLHTVELLAMAEERVFPSFPSKGD